MRAIFWCILMLIPYVHMPHMEPKQPSFWRFHPWNGLNWRAKHNGALNFQNTWGLLGFHAYILIIRQHEVIQASKFPYSRPWAIYFPWCRKRMDTNKFHLNIYIYYVVLSGSIWVLHHIDSIVMPLPLPFGRSLSHLSKLLKHQLGLTDTVHLQITGKAWPSQLISNSPTASCHLIFSEYCGPNNKSTPWWWKNMGTSWKITSFKTWMTYNHPSSTICNSLVPAWCQPGFMPSPASMTNIPASMLQCGFWSFHSLTTLECRTSTTTRPVMK